jgi:aryl-alcohol dehydrogenase-like predicted oxidoreductase
MRRLQSMHPIASLQPPYNMLARGIEDETLPYCSEHKIGVICYSPMCKGLLTGAFGKARAESLPDSDHRSRDPKFQEPLLGVNLQLVDGLRPIAEQSGRTLAQLAIAWVLCRSEVTGAIVGARRPEQIKGTAPAGDWQLSTEEFSQIEQLLQRRDDELQRIGPVDAGRV